MTELWINSNVFAAQSDRAFWNFLMVKRSLWLFLSLFNFSLFCAFILSYSNLNWSFCTSALWYTSENSKGYSQVFSAPNTLQKQIENHCWKLKFKCLTQRVTDIWVFQHWLHKHDAIWQGTGLLWDRCHHSDLMLKSVAKDSKHDVVAFFFFWFREGTLKLYISFKGAGVSLHPGGRKRGEKKGKKKKSSFALFLN